MSEELSFFAQRARGLRRRGLQGKVTVAWVKGALHLRGEKRGHLSISPEDIEKLYAGWAQRNGIRSYHLTLWFRDQEPLVLGPQGNSARERQRYGATARALLAEMERRGIINRAVGGLLWHKPWRLVWAVGVFALVACTLVFWLLEDRPLWERLVPTYIMLPVLALCVWAAHAYRPPPPAACAADVEVGLPPSSSRP